MLLSSVVWLADWLLLLAGRCVGGGRRRAHRRPERTHAYANTHARAGTGRLSLASARIRYDPLEFRFATCTCERTHTKAQQNSCRTSSLPSLSSSSTSHVGYNFANVLAVRLVAHPTFPKKSSRYVNYFRCHSTARSHFNTYRACAASCKWCAYNMSRTHVAFLSFLFFLLSLF